MVGGVWTDAATGRGSCTPDLSGQCSIDKSNIKTNITSVVFTIENIDLAGYTYSPDANHDPDGDSDGTTITIYIPS